MGKIQDYVQDPRNRPARPALGLAWILKSDQYFHISPPKNLKQGAAELGTQGVYLRTHMFGP